MWDPTWKALPNQQNGFSLLTRLGQLGKTKTVLRKIPSCFPVLHLEIAAFVRLMVFVHSRGEQFSQGVLFPHRIYGMRWIQIILSLPLRWVRTGPYFQTLLCNSSLGDWVRLVRGEVGKRRIFAIGNYVNQRLLRPCHEWLMSVLSG